MKTDKHRYEIASDKHRYEIVPIINGAHKYPHHIIGEYVREATGEMRSFEAAMKTLNERAEVERFHIYHTHPSPGPVRRFIGIVTRDSTGIKRPT